MRKRFLVYEVLLCLLPFELLLNAAKQELDWRTAPYWIGFGLIAGTWIQNTYILLNVFERYGICESFCVQFRIKFSAKVLLHEIAIWLWPFYYLFYYRSIAYDATGNGIAQFGVLVLFSLIVSISLVLTFFNLMPSNKANEYLSKIYMHTYGKDYSTGKEIYIVVIGGLAGLLFCF